MIPIGAVSRRWTTSGAEALSGDGGRIVRRRCADRAVRDEARPFSSTRCIACRGSTRSPRSRPRSRRARRSRSRSSTCACRRGSTARKPRRGSARSIPNINLVIVTGFSDFSPIEISQGGGAGRQDLLHRQAVRDRRGRPDRDRARASLAGRSRSGAAASGRQVQLRNSRPNSPRTKSKALHLATHDSLTEAPNRLAFVQRAGRKVRGGGHVRHRDGRSRSLQAGQRHARPSGGRRIDPRDLRHPARQRPRRRDRRAAGRRRIRRAVRHRRRTSRGDGVRPHRRGVRDAASASSAIRSRARRRSASSWSRRRGRDPIDVMRRADLALNDAKKSGAASSARSTKRWTRASVSAAASKAGWARRSTQGELSLAYQPIVAGHEWKSSGSKRCCAGTPRNSGRSARRCSSRSPRNRT